MKKWILSILAALATAVSLACDCPYTRTGAPCPCPCICAPGMPCSCGTCTCDYCGENPPMPSEFYIGFKGRCSISTSVGCPTMTYPSDGFKNYFPYDQSEWFSEDGSTWFSIPDLSSCEYFEMTVYPYEGWRIPDCTEILCNGWSCTPMSTAGDDGSVTFSVNKSYVDPYMQNDPTMQYTYVAIACERIYRITFNAAEHGELKDWSLYEQWIPAGYDATDPGVTANAGWQFLKWDHELTNIQYDMDIMALYAQEQVTSYTVTFVAGEYGVISNADLRAQVVPEHKDAADPGVIPSNGWTFVEWDRSFKDITADTVVSARYERVYCQVVFNPGDNGTLADSSLRTQMVAYGTAATKPKVKVKSEYPDLRFKRWTPSTDNVISNMEATAVYGPPVYYTVTTNGVPLPASPVESGTSVYVVAPNAIYTDDTHQTFRGYMGTGSFRSYGTDSEFGTYIYEDSTLYWLFDTQYRLLITCNDSSRGTIEITGTTATTGYETWWPADAMLTIRASTNIPTDTVSITVNGEPCEGEGNAAYVWMDGPKYVNVTFQPLMHTVIVDGVSTQVEHGTKVTYYPPEDINDNYTYRVYKNRWKGTGSFTSGSSNTGPVANRRKPVSATITEDSTLTWICDTSYRLEIEKTGSGKLYDANSGTYIESGWFPADTSFDLRTEEVPGVKCLYFAVNGEEIEGDRFQFEMDSPTLVEVDYETVTYTVTFDPSEYAELTNPDLAVQVLNPGDYPIVPDVVAKAEYADEWTFYGWPQEVFDPVYQDVTFYATYTYSPRPYYDVTVNGETTRVKEGTTVYFSAPAPEEPTADTRQIYTGYTGSGSFPPSGTEREVSATIYQDSRLDWNYEWQYRLLAESNDAALGYVWDATNERLVTSESWWTSGTTVSLVGMPADANMAECRRISVNGVDYESDRVSFTIDGPTSVQAVFATRSYTVAFDPGEYGVLEDSRLAEQRIEYGKNAIKPDVIVKDEYAHDWKCIGWNPNPVNITTDMSCQAMYVARVWHNVTIRGVGEDEVEDGEVKTYRVVMPETDEGVQLVCTGWTGTGSFPANGTETQVTAKIEEDSELTWLFATNYLLKVDHSTHGDVIDAATGASLGEVWLPAGTNLTVRAVPDADARFDSWTSEGVEPAPTAADVALTMNGPVSLFGKFVPTHVKVTFNAAPHGTIASADEAEQNIEYGGDAVAPKVAVQDGWILTGWDKPFTNVLEDIVVNARYTCRYTIMIDGKPVTVNDLNDMTFETFSSREANGMQRICTGWTGSGSFPESGTGNSVTVTITNDSSLVWLYATNYYFEVDNEGPGAICDPDTRTPLTDCWMPSGTNFVVEAVPDDDAYFVKWDVDGVVTNAGQYVVCFMEAPSRVAATFGRDCAIEASIDDSGWENATEDDDIMLRGVISGGSATAYLWRAIQLDGANPDGLATDISSACESTVQLTAGTWRIEFYACDESGTWSQPTVRELVVKTGEVLPDLQLYSDEIAFCNAAGGEVNHAEVGSTVTVKVRLKNGYRAAMTGPIDVCLCDGWVTENDFLTFSSAHSNVLACASIHDGMDCGETVELEIPWTVGSDRAGIDLGYGNGSRPITLVAVSRNNVEELRLNNNLTSRLFAIGTEEDLDIMRISISGAATWSEGGISLVSGKCWYSFKGENKPAIGCPVQLSIDGTGVGGNRIYTVAPDGSFSLIVHSPRAGTHTLTAEATDGIMTCSTEMPFKSVPMIADYRPNLYVKSLVASGSGIYKHTKDVEIVHRGGEVVLTAEIVNNGHIATESAFDVQLMVRDNGDKKEWENVGTAVRIASGFAVGASTNLSFVVPDWITKGLATRHLCVYADNKNEVAESNESWVDNSKECLIAVREGPDLDPNGPFIRPNTVVCGERLSVECTVHNKGLVTADTPFSLDVCIDDQVVACRRITTEILPGDAYTCTIELDTGDLAPGYHSVSLHADSEGEVTELSEENNWSSTSINIFPAEPELSLRAQDIAWTPTGEPVAGRTYTFSAKISNAYYTIAATNAVVSFSILEGGEYVSLGEVTVKELARNSNVVVSAPSDYVATRGFHVVKVSVRTADGVDQKPSNNEATTSFDVEVPLAVVDDNAFVNAVAGVPIELDGSKSKHGKYFAWTILDRPQDSSPVLSASTQSIASFTPDIIGRYELQFSVRDDEFQGEPVKVVVDVTRVFIDAVGTCGTLTPTGRVIYAKNETPTYTFEPWVMYALENVVLDNQTLANATATYAFAPLDRSHKLSVEAVCIYPGDIVASDDGTFTLVPRNTVDTLDISSFPANVAAENVTVAVKPGFKTVRLPKGAHVKIVTEGNGRQYDITKYVDCAGTDSNGHTVWNVAEAKLKDTDGAISRSLDLTPESGAIFNPSATNPITTANTIKGLTYTLHESTTVDGLRSDSAKRYTKVGDGDPWTPEVSTERGDSGFYTLSVSK